MIFIDCEFTDFISPELLSIALVSDNGDEFYMEIDVDLKARHFNNFVLTSVLSQFGVVPSVAKSNEEIGRQIKTWLSRYPKKTIEVAYDYHTDFDLLEEVLKAADLWDALRGVLIPMHVGYMLGHEDVTTAMEASWMKSSADNGIERHHALADARALMCGFNAIHNGY